MNFAVYVPEKDSKELAKAMIRALSDSKLRQGYALNGYNHVHKNFTWESIAKRYAEEYEKAQQSQRQIF